MWYFCNLFPEVISRIEKVEVLVVLSCCVVIKAFIKVMLNRKLTTFLDAGTCLVL